MIEHQRPSGHACSKGSLLLTHTLDAAPPARQPPAVYAGRDCVYVSVSIEGCCI